MRQDEACIVVAAQKMAELEGMGPAALKPRQKVHAPRPPMTKAERALWLMFTVNTCLTVAQLSCGFVAHSLALLSDGALMAMDGVTYAVGLYAERHKAAASDSTTDKEAREKAAEKADRHGAIFSVVMLALTTCWVLFDVVDRLMAVSDDDGRGRNEPEVNGAVMIAFTAVNLVADTGVVVVCWLCCASMLGGPESSESDAANMNIWSALAHLGADVVRGFAVLVCGILAVAGAVDATKADAYCTLFVCVFVLLAAFSLLQAILRRSTPVAYENLDSLQQESKEEHSRQENQPAGSPIGSPISQWET